MNFYSRFDWSIDVSKEFHVEWSFFLLQVKLGNASSVCFWEWLLEGSIRGFELLNFWEFQVIKATSKNVNGIYFLDPFRSFGNSFRLGFRRFRQLSTSKSVVNCDSQVSEVMYESVNVIFDFLSFVFSQELQRVNWTDYWLYKNGSFP